MAFSMKELKNKLNELPSEDRAPLVELPEDVLLAVFALLPWQELLRGPRGVCRSWRQAALQRVLWKGVCLSLTRSCSARVHAALRLAPCLRRLELRTDVRALGETIDAAISTDCAVTELVLEFPDEFRNDAPIRLTLEGVLYRQVDLGNLQELNLHKLPRESALAVVEKALTAKLTKLAIRYSNRQRQPVPAPSHQFPVCPSLKEFVYDNGSHDPFLPLLIKLLTGSLESVTIYAGISRYEVDLLCKCAKLREMRVPRLLPADLGALTQLTSLSFMMEESAAPLIPYFKNATQLVKLTFDDGVDCVDASVMDLLAALATSSRSALEELSIEGIIGLGLDPESWMTFDPSAGMAARVEAFRRFPLILPGFPHLHTLRLHHLPPEEIVNAITPVMAPSLRLLCLTGYCSYDETFADGMCRSHDSNVNCWVPILCDLVRRNPLLHVVGVGSRHFCLGSWQCDCCRQRLHPVAKPRHRFNHWSLFGHPEEQDCRVEAHKENAGVCRAGTTSDPLCPCQHVWRYVHPRA